jgi:hypothetical protein
LRSERRRARVGSSHRAGTCPRCGGLPPVLPPPSRLDAPRIAPCSLYGKVQGLPEARQKELREHSVSRTRGRSDADERSAAYITILPPRRGPGALCRARRTCTSGTGTPPPRPTTTTTLLRPSSRRSHGGTRATRRTSRGATRAGRSRTSTRCVSCGARRRRVRLPPLHGPLSDHHRPAAALSPHAQWLDKLVTATNNETAVCAAGRSGLPPTLRCHATLASRELKKGASTLLFWHGFLRPHVARARAPSFLLITLRPRSNSS